MVEEKCVSVIDSLLVSPEEQLTDARYTALVNLHKVLLDEFFDYVMASQLPNATPESMRSVKEKQLFARMWNNVIRLIDYLQDRSPESLEHHLRFQILAYSRLTMMLECIPSFADKWMTCLADLARSGSSLDGDEDHTWAQSAEFWSRCRQNGDFPSVEADDTIEAGDTVKDDLMV